MAPSQPRTSLSTVKGDSAQKQQMIHANKVPVFWLVLTAFLIVSAANAQQPLLQITSPADQSLAPEGQTLTITVSADPSVRNIYVMTEHPLPAVQPTPSPTQFTLTLPTNISPGLYQIGAVGLAPTGLAESSPLQIDVERQDAPVSLTVNPGIMTFSVGDTRSIDLRGTFADGAKLWISHSTLPKYFSCYAAVITVAPNGLVTAVGPGQSCVTVRYGRISTTFQVIVAQPPPSGPPPEITGVTPTSGTPGVTQVSIIGSNFGSSQGNGWLQIGNTNATTISSWTNTQIVATVPVGSLSGVAMVNQNGLYSNEIPFTIFAPSTTPRDRR
jgi:hypothetical protein